MENIVINGFRTPRNDIIITGDSERRVRPVERIVIEREVEREVEIVYDLDFGLYDDDEDDIELFHISVCR